MSFWDTLVVGSATEIGRYTFTREEIMRFAEKYDPQRFHLDENDAEGTLFGALCASGWHTAAVMMRMIVEDQNRRVKAYLSDGGALPKLGPSPGAKNLRWIKPVYADDTLTYRQTLVAKRKSASKPGWGIIETKVEAMNQHREPVFSMDGAAFVGTD